MGLGGFSRGRRILGASEGVVAALVVTALVAALCFAATRPALRQRIDLSATASTVLSEQTRSILAALPARVRLTLIMRPELTRIPNGLAEVQQRAIDYVASLAREYALASGGQVTLRRLDPNADVLELQELARHVALTRYNVVIVESGARLRQVYLEDLVTIDRGLAEPPNIRPAELVDLRGEAPLTSAIVDVGSGTPPVVGVVTGFGGPQPDDTGDFGLAVLMDALVGQGLDPQPLDLSEGWPSSGAGAQAAALMLWGPQLPLTAAAAEALGAAARAGRGLLVACDPRHEDARLDELLAQLGVQRERAVLARDDVPWEGERRAILTIAEFPGTHPVAQALARQGSFATLALATGLMRAPDTPATRIAEALAYTSAEVFGDHAPPGGSGDWTFGDGEVRGKRAVGLALADGDGGRRAVVFGSASFLTNAFLVGSTSGPANLDLGLHSIHWLVQREEAIAVRPRRVHESRVDLTAEESLRIALYVLLLLPLGGLLAGSMVWFARRR